MGGVPRESDAARRTENGAVRLPAVRGRVHLDRRRPFGLQRLVARRERASIGASTRRIGSPWTRASFLRRRIAKSAQLRAVDSLAASGSGTPHTFVSNMQANVPISLEFDGASARASLMRSANDWAPDGKRAALVHRASSSISVQFPGQHASDRSTRPAHIAISTVSLRG